MNCVILGPSNIKKINKFGKIKDVNKYILETADFLANNFDEILIVPDYGLTLLIAQKYKKIAQNGIVTGYIPDKSSNGKDISVFYKYCDNIKGIGGGWHNLNTELTRNSEKILCFGFSVGVFIELCSIKYNQQYFKIKTQIFIDERCISARLPAEVAIDLKYLNYFNDFSVLAKKIKSKKH